jgi:Protein of unknown function (DUF1579)
MRKQLLILGCVLALSAQDSPFPKPTAHHLAMKDQVGTWTAVARMYMEPGKPPMVSKGTETNTLVAGGLWLKSELRAEMMGLAFEGHGLFGYDTQVNAHVGAWVDNSGTWMAVTKGTCAKDCKEQTTFFEGYDEAGKHATFKEIHTQVDRDHRTMVMFTKAKDGSFVRNMDMEYTRAK